MDFSFDPARTLLGTVFTHAGEEELALTETDRLNHMLVIGKTGMGKTTLLKNIALQDMHTGRGVGVIDPHGDLSRDLLQQYPLSRARDLVYIDPGDEERVVTFNPLEKVPPQRIAAVTAEIVAMFKARWGDSWGPRMERILYNATAALIEATDTSLLGLPRLLKDEWYRSQILERIQDPLVLSFFTEQFAVWDEEYRASAVEPVLNKVEPLLSSPVVRAMLGCSTSSIDIREIMDGRKILIANLSKGVLGPGHAHLLGAMLVSCFSNAAMERGAHGTPETRVPFHLIVDEFQNFSTDSFADIASEARKWRLGLVLGHQLLAQLPPNLRATILGTVGSIAAFQLSGDDAETIAKDIGLKRPAALTELSIGEAWFKHARYGGPYRPKLLEPIVTEAEGKEPALKQNRMRNTFSRERVERKITRFLTGGARHTEL